MNNKEAIEILKVYKQKLENSCSNQLDEDIMAFDFAIKALDLVEQLENMRDNAYRLYNVEKGDGDYSYGRKQVLGTVHSDLEELLEVFEEAENVKNSN
jgi:hypothetical protein